MTLAQLEKRIAAVEAELERLRDVVRTEDEWHLPWWRRISGSFEGDAMYADAMKLGRSYRKATPGRKRKRRNGRPGH